MRKALLITTIFLLLTLTLTQLAAADFTVANDSNTKVKVIYVYFDPSQEAFRIKGYYHINPGKSKRLKVPDEVDQVVARIWTASEVVGHDRSVILDMGSPSEKGILKAYDPHEDRVCSSEQCSARGRDGQLLIKPLSYDNNTLAFYGLTR